MDLIQIALKHREEIIELLGRHEDNVWNLDIDMSTIVDPIVYQLLKVQRSRRMRTITMLKTSLQFFVSSMKRWTTQKNNCTYESREKKTVCTTLGSMCGTLSHGRVIVSRIRNFN